MVMVKGFNEAWRNSGRKESEISIRYQYKIRKSEARAVKCSETGSRFGTPRDSYRKSS